MHRKEKKIIFMAVVLLAILVFSGLPPAQSRELSLDNLKQLAGNGEVLADPEAAQCILAAAVAQFPALNACGDDVTCKATLAASLLLDVLVCANPDNESLVFFDCILDPIIALSEVSSLCGDDRLCLVQNALPVVLELSGCLNDLNGGN
jgi:hypothetical protein